MQDHASLAGAAASIPLLSGEDPEPVSAVNCGASSPFLLTCDHAGRAVPAALSRLGLPAAAFDFHIAWDLGALDLARRLAAALDACLISQAYSRLVIDCNRSPDHPQAMAPVSDAVEIPGNLALSAANREARIAAVHRPYHDRIAAELDDRAKRKLPSVLVCVHSFTPMMAGEARPWEVGVLHGGASPVCRALLGLLRADGGLIVGDNQPYAMDGTDYTIPHHAWPRGLDAVELEVRQDLLATPGDAAHWADLLARLLPQALSAARDGEAP